MPLPRQTPASVLQPQRLPRTEPVFWFTSPKASSQHSTSAEAIAKKKAAGGTERHKIAQHSRTQHHDTTSQRALTQPTVYLSIQHTPALRLRSAAPSTTNDPHRRLHASTCSPIWQSRLRKTRANDQNLHERSPGAIDWIESNGVSLYKPVSMQASKPTST
jgi:hypothetical protein